MIYDPTQHQSDGTITPAFGLALIGVGLLSLLLLLQQLLHRLFFSSQSSMEEEFIEESVYDIVTDYHFSVYAGLSLVSLNEDPIMMLLDGDTYERLYEGDPRIWSALIYVIEQELA